MHRILYIYICTFQNGHNNVVKLLLKEGANVNQESAAGCIPLTVAAGKGNAQTVDILLQNGKK